MKVILDQPSAIVLRIDRDEDIVSSLKNFCSERNIYAASFSGIGAAKSATLSWYEAATQTYHDTTYEGEYEIVGLTGNVSRLGDDIIIHAHGVISDKSMRPISGHVKSLVVSLTCEVVMRLMEGTIKREKDDATGLNLLASWK